MKYLTYLFLMSLFVSSCDKSNLNISCQPEKYFPLEVGNYWIYRNYVIMEDGTHVDRTIDSLYISEDTLMWGDHYFHLEGYFLVPKIDVWLRYDDGQVISSENGIFFDCPGFINSKGESPWAHFGISLPYETSRCDTAIKVTAGEFNSVMVFEGLNWASDTTWTWGSRFFYAKNVGLIRYSDGRPNHPEYHVMELLRYYVNIGE